MGKLSEALAKGGDDRILTPPLTEKEAVAEVRETPPPPLPTREEGLEALHSSRQRWDERLLLTTDPYSPLAENVRRLRAAILHPPSGPPPRTILITSLAPNEGKGFVCANLGVALAEGLEHHALMVDCDLRRPSLAGIFGLTNEPGLVDVLQDNVDLSLVIRKTGQTKLSIISSGRPPRNPAELLDSKKIVRFIDEVAQRYDDRIILFDSPPAVVASETGILSKQVDGVILVVRWGVSRREDLQRIIESIGREKIIGIVFNAYEESRAENLLYRKGAGYHYSKYYSG